MLLSLQLSRVWVRADRRIICWDGELVRSDHEYIFEIQTISSCCDACECRGGQNTCSTVTEIWRIRPATAFFRDVEDVKTKNKNQTGVVCTAHAVKRYESF